MDYYPSWYMNNNNRSPSYPSHPCLDPPSPPSPSMNAVHDLVALPQAPQAVVESYILQSNTKDGKLAYRCTYFSCKKPNKMFMSKENARVHVQHELGYESLYMCRGCDARFSSKDTAKRHVMSKTAGKQYPCQYCGAVFERKDYRATHESHQKCRQGRAAHQARLKAAQTGALKMELDDSPSPPSSVHDLHLNVDVHSLNNSGYYAPSYHSNQSSPTSTYQSSPMTTSNGYQAAYRGDVLQQVHSNASSPSEYHYPHAHSSSNASSYGHHQAAQYSHSHSTSYSQPTNAHPSYNSQTAQAWNASRHHSDLVHPEQHQHTVPSHQQQGHSHSHTGQAQWYRPPYQVQDTGAAY
ncbi:hypothetical protein M422DRAFT_271796 [Sphaerobolus stellatus SS14]|uniref:C2H2-type domain-containing protein n=1 Tax=Sphaerobolus stellatus (strain SS14) TaxID=990650 RepID=A0A0C9UD25_SPHS4|nr:hypothetical protein M422DRAFT_271796 [Sphaerobolus stellatus SS14]